MSTERSKCQPCLDPRLALGLRHVPVIPPMRDHCGDQLPVLRNQLLLVLANSKVLGLARAKRDALPVLLKEWRSMIGSPQDCKSCIDFCVVFSNQDKHLALWVCAELADPAGPSSSPQPNCWLEPDQGTHNAGDVVLPALRFLDRLMSPYRLPYMYDVV